MNLAPILYWFPGSTEPPAAYAARFQDSTGADRGAFSRQSEGPDPGIRGCLASPMCGVWVCYRPQDQRWDRIAPGVWLGAGRGCKPELFARSHQYTGYRRTLGDGNEWVIPIANPFARLCSLPAHDILRDGAWVREIDERFRSLSDQAAALSERVRLAMFDGHPDEASTLEMDDDEQRKLFADVLALNYDLTLAEMSALRLFDPAAYWSVASAFIDWDGTKQAMAEAIVGGGQSAAPFGDFVRSGTSATVATVPVAVGIV
jgi:hypothetical protein